jgi:hypothetical protein
VLHYLGKVSQISEIDLNEKAVNISGNWDQMLRPEGRLGLEDSWKKDSKVTTQAAFRALKTKTMDFVLIKWEVHGGFKPQSNILKKKKLIPVAGSSGSHRQSQLLRKKSSGG